MPGRPPGRMSAAKKVKLDHDRGRNGEVQVDHSITSCTVLDTLPLVLSFLPLKDLLCQIRPLSHRFRDLCDTDGRWLPVIPPPSLAHEVLDLEQHGPALRQYFVEFGEVEGTMEKVVRTARNIEHTERRKET